MNRLDMMIVVHKIPCRNCDANDVGQTSRQLATQLTQHQQAVACRDKLSLVVAHCHNLQHNFAWENTVFKASAPNQSSQEILETWLLGTRSINHHIDLHAAYRGGHNHPQPPPTGANVKPETQIWGRHETSYTGPVTQRPEPEANPSSKHT